MTEQTIKGQAVIIIVIALLRSDVVDVTEMFDAAGRVSIPQIVLLQLPSAVVYQTTDQVIIGRLSISTVHHRLLHNKQQKSLRYNNSFHFECAYRKAVTSGLPGGLQASNIKEPPVT